MSIFNFHRTWLVFQIFWIISDITEFLEQAKLQISALNVMAIIVLRHIYVIKQKSYWRTTKRASEWKTVWIKIRSDVLLGSDLDLNCLQRLSADGTSRHSHFVLSAGSTHPNITEKLLTRFNSLPHIFPHCEIISLLRVFHYVCKTKRWLGHHYWVAVSNN